MATITITNPNQLAATRAANPADNIIVAPPGRCRWLSTPDQYLRPIGIVVPPRTVRP